MKFRMMMPSIAAVLLGLGASTSFAEDFKATCPVSGHAAKEAQAVRFKGKSLYFCCENCPTAFKNDRKKYMAKANMQLLETGQIVAVACPIAGRPINPSTAIKVGTVKVAFCCNNCKGKAEKAGDDAVNLVFANAAFNKGYTLQTKCPVSGKPIDATKTVTHNGTKVYFCCPNCPKAFEANPDKFVAKVPQLKVRKKKSN